jgi:Na+/H+-dicarboxylate symporter
LACFGVNVLQPGVGFTAGDTDLSSAKEVIGKNQLLVPWMNLSGTFFPKSIFEAMGH